LLEGPFYVTFEVNLREVRQPTPDHEHWTLDMLKDGFWVTQEHILCRETQGHFWIPPSRIVLIEKRDQAPISV